MKQQSDKEITMRVSKVSVVFNVALTAFKLFAGIVANSGAMVADAIHSASDVVGSFLVIIGAQMSNRASDKTHPYGHERLECVISIILANILFLVALGIGLSGFNKILAGEQTLVIPGALALVAAVLSLVVKEALFWYTKAAAHKINSVSLLAEAWHHRSDALSSVGSFVGILGARLGFPILDPIASIVIALFILKVSFDIFRDTLDRLVDRACDEEIVSRMREIISGCAGVLSIDDMKTRLFGSKLYVEVEIGAKGTMSLAEGHEICVQVHNQIEQNFPLVKHCVVHVNPK